MQRSFDVIAQRLFVSLFGTAAVLFSIAAILYSLQPVQASQPTMTNAVGKYMMSESGFTLNGKPIYHILVWDTETGKSKLYNFGSGEQKMISVDYQLPSSPIY